MTSSDAPPGLPAGLPPSVAEYFAALDPARLATILPVFETVRKAMPPGYELLLDFGMPGWAVPLATYPDTYNGHPLAYVGLAAQKRYNSLYLMGCQSDDGSDAAFRTAWEATGRRLDMGKSCLRFRADSDLDHDLIAATVSAYPVERFIERYERSRRTPASP